MNRLLIDLIIFCENNSVIILRRKDKIKRCVLVNIV